MPQPTTDFTGSDAVIAALTDLIFATRIRSTAQALGIPAIIVPSLEELKQSLDRFAAGLVLIDLNGFGEDAIRAVTMARQHPSRPRVLAYAAHVDRQLADSAKQNGAHEVLPRSRFHAELPRILKPEHREAGAD